MVWLPINTKKNLNCVFAWVWNFSSRETLTSCFITCTTTVWSENQVGVHVKVPIWENGRRTYLFRLLFGVDDEGLLCQFLFRWLMNQLLICFSCKPVSCTSLALSSSWQSILYNIKSWVEYGYSSNSISNGEHIWSLSAYCRIRPFGMWLPPRFQDRRCITRQFSCSSFS